MHNNIWNKLPKGFLVLAPMEDVTDSVFRRVIAECGRPDLFFTEFTNCDGICSVGQAKVIHRLKYEPSEKPLIAQIWGKTPENYFETARLVCELGFDGIDINMGCPEKSVIKQGACSALIKNPDLAKEIIHATQEGSGGKIPISVKTRIGFDAIITETWCEFLLRCNIQALTIHGRTVKELSEVPAHWDEIAKVVALRDRLVKEKTIDYVPIIGNGDVMSYQDAQSNITEFGVDGVMIGRGVFSNPYIFNPHIIKNELGGFVNTLNSSSIGKHELLSILLRHVQLWQETWGTTKNINILKKYIKIYCNGFVGAVALRTKLMEQKSLEDLQQVVLNELKTSVTD